MALSDQAASRKFCAVPCMFQRIKHGAIAAGRLPIRDTGLSDLRKSKSGLSFERSIRFSAGLALGLALSALPCHVLADKVPRTAFSGKQFYFTKDGDPVRINFSGGQRNIELRKQDPVYAHGEIERSYIYFAEGYDQDRFTDLPNEIWTHSLGIFAVYPSLRPYSLAYAELLKKEKIAFESEKRHVEVSPLRYNTIRIEFSTVTDAAHAKNNYVYNPFLTMKRIKHIGEVFPGLQFYSWGEHGSQIYLDPENKKLRKIRCSGIVETASPIGYCDYQIVLSKNLLATATFFDFRLQSDTNYVTERVDKIHAFLCQRFTCSDPG